MDPLTAGLLALMLSDPRCAVRQRADAYLDGRGGAAVPVLLCLAQSAEPEVRHRCRRLLARRRAERLAALAADFVPLPDLRAVPPEYCDDGTYWRLREDGNNLPGNTEQVATWLWLVERAEAGDDFDGLRLALEAGRHHMDLNDYWDWR